MNKQRKKTAPKVKDGKVQKKNNWTETPTYWNTTQKIPVIDKEPAGRGYKHFLRKKDIFAFIELLPDWNELSKGLDAVILATANEDEDDGWIGYGVIAICAWSRDMWKTYSSEYYHDHKKIFERLGVICRKTGKEYECQFTEAQIRGYLLLHIFLHELGHHHDKMSTKKKKYISRGESYAENYALAYEKQIWNDYIDQFGI